MPLYEYRCAECGRVFEALQRLHDAPLDACRHCGGAARRIISTPAIQFVGSGWYVTDYARKGEAGKDGNKERDQPGAKTKEGTKGPESDGGGSKPGDSGAGGASSGRDAPGRGPSAPSGTKDHAFPAGETRASSPP